MLNELNVDLTRGLAAMAGSHTPVIVNAVHAIQGLKNNIENDSGFFKTLLGQFSEQQSRSLIAALGTGNKGFKLDTLEKIYFSGQLNAFATLKADADSLREMFASVLLYGFTKSYSNDKGEIGWLAAQNDIITSLGNRAFGAGHAAAKAMAVPPAAPGDVLMG